MRSVREVVENTIVDRMNTHILASQEQITNEDQQYYLCYFLAGHREALRYTIAGVEARTAYSMLRWLRAHPTLTFSLD